MCTTSHINHPRKPESPDALEAHHGVETRDRGHAAEVAIGERRRLLAVEPALDRVRGMDARLHGDLGDAGEVVERHHVADREHLGMVRQRAVRQYADPAGPVAGRPAGLGEQARQRRRRTPAAQIFVRARDPVLGPVVRGDVDTEGVDAGDDRHRSGSSRRAARARSPPCGRAGRRTPPGSPGHRRPARPWPRPGRCRRKLPFSPRRESSAIWPAISTPVAPPPTTTKVSHARRASGSSSFSAISKAPKIRPRSSSASSIVFMPGANRANSS